LLLPPTIRCNALSDQSHWTWTTARLLLFPRVGDLLAVDILCLPHYRARRTICAAMPAGRSRLALRSLAYRRATRSPLLHVASRLTPPPISGISASRDRRRCCCR